MRGLIGVDIGGTGIKGATVDSRRGVLTSERIRVLTPQPAKPEAVVAATAGLIAELGPDEGPVGIGLPSPIVGGVAMAAANIHKSWVGVNAVEAFTEAVRRPCTVLNDADGAGLAEMRFGAGKGVKGVVLMLTLGTGIGSALFVDGALVPNLELGHIEIRGKDAEKRASAGARDRRGLSYKQWAPLLNEYLDRIDALIWPDLVILGGGVSKRAERFVPLIDVRPPVVPAMLRNEAGIVGTAMRARELQTPVARAKVPRRPARRGSATA